MKHEVFTSISTKNTVFCNIWPRSLVHRNRRSQETRYVLLIVSISVPKVEKAGYSEILGSFQPAFKVSHPRRLHCSQKQMFPTFGISVSDLTLGPTSHLTVHRIYLQVCSIPVAGAIKQPFSNAEFYSRESRNLTPHALLYATTSCAYNFQQPKHECLTQSYQLFRMVKLYRPRQSPTATGGCDAQEYQMADT